jgi:hypothetical protein
MTGRISPSKEGLLKTGATGTFPSEELFDTGLFPMTGKISPSKEGLLKTGATRGTFPQSELFVIVIVHINMKVDLRVCHLSRCIPTSHLLHFS